MQAFKEAVTVVLSPSERDSLMSHICVIWDHVEEHLKRVGDIQSQTPEAKLQDAMHALERLHFNLKNGKHA